MLQRIQAYLFDSVLVTNLGLLKKNSVSYQVYQKCIDRPYSRLYPVWDLSDSSQWSFLSYLGEGENGGWELSVANGLFQLHSLTNTLMFTFASFIEVLTCSFEERRGGCYVC